MTDEHDIQRARRHIVSQRITPNQFVAMFPSKFVSSRNIRDIASGMDQRQLQVTGWDRILRQQPPAAPAQPSPEQIQKENLDRAIATYEETVAVTRDPIDRLTLARLRQEREAL